MLIIIANWKNVFIHLFLRDEVPIFYAILFDFPIFWLWAYLMKVIPEMLVRIKIYIYIFIEYSMQVFFKNDF